MCKKKLIQCRTSSDFIRYARVRGGRLVPSKKGVKVYGPTPCGYVEIHSNHPHELATGTRAVIIKAFVAIGLAIIGLAAILLPALAGG